MNRFLRIPSLVKINALILCILVFVAIAGNRAISVVTENAPLSMEHCIIIDPGHGGVDGGATSFTGVLESTMNLEIALRLDDLMHLLGIQTSMVRKTDISVYSKGESIAAKKVSDLKNRVSLVNNTPGAVLISIHQNHFTDSRYSGAQVFYASTTGSNLLAERMQTGFITTINQGSKRRAKKADGVYLLENIKCPGILIECGFISNQQEEAKLRDAEYQKKLCCAIAATTSTYLFKNTLA